MTEQKKAPAARRPANPAAPKQEAPPPAPEVEAPDHTDLPPLSARSALVAVMGLVQRVAKSQYNDHQKFNFRGVDAVYNAVGPAMRQVGASITYDIEKVKRRETQTSQGKATVETMVRLTVYWFGTDGGEPIVTRGVWGESLDNGSFGLAKAISVALRTYYINTLVIPSGDPDDDQSGNQRTAPDQAQARAAAGRPQRPPQHTMTSLQTRITQLSAGKTEQEIVAAVSAFTGITDPTKFTVPALLAYAQHLEAQASAPVAEDAPPPEPSDEPGTDAPMALASSETPDLFGGQS